MTSPSAAETSAPTTNPPATAGPASGTKNAWAGGLTVFAGVILATVALSVKSSGTRVLSLFGLILWLVDPGLRRHPRRMGPTTEPRWVGMVGHRQGLLPGLVDRVGSPEMHR